MPLEARFEKNLVPSQKRHVPDRAVFSFFPPMRSEISDFIKYLCVYTVLFLMHAGHARHPYEK